MTAAATTADMSFNSLVDTPWFTSVKPYDPEVMRECIEKKLLVYYAPRYEGENYEFSHALYAMEIIKKNTVLFELGPATVDMREC